MQHLEHIVCGKTYHIYNCGINGCDLFRGKENYEYFLNLYDKHISPVADTFAWVLMKNHFHLLVRIKDEEYIKNLEGFRNLRGLKLHQPFSNLFNAYTKALNKRLGRTGSLFENRFHRKLISDIEYFRRLVIYIHNNPVHHKFTEHAMDYPWSSYLTCISVKPNRLLREAVMGWFDNEANFKTAHENPGKVIELEQWLGL
jgi:REP element-mobilizing transposase RayT